MYIFTFYNTSMGLLSLDNDILTLMILLYLQPHLRHDVVINILLKSFSCDSFSRILSKTSVSNCLILQVFHQISLTQCQNISTYDRDATQTHASPANLMHQKISLPFTWLTCTYLSSAPRVNHSSSSFAYLLVRLLSPKPLPSSWDTPEVWPDPAPCL